MSFIELSKKRYSTRSFSSKKVEEEKIQLLLEAAQSAPTAKNNQPQHIYLLQSEDALEKAKKATPCVYGAPLVFLVCINMNEVWTSSSEKGVDSADIDGSIITTHIALEAADIGLSSCIVRMFDSEKVKEIFALPSYMKPVLFLPVGYPSEKDQPNPRHYSRKLLSETVTKL